MKSKKHYYSSRAAYFVERAEAASDAHARTAYENLADCYRLLAEKFSGIAEATDTEIEALAERIVERA